jgi:hypothetical protein
MKSISSMNTPRRWCLIVVDQAVSFIVLRILTRMEGKSRVFLLDKGKARIDRDR